MFDLTFLGTAASTPSGERGLPALLVGAGGERFLVDCGEGTTRQLLRAGRGFRRLGHVLLTHDDLDHVLGLGGLVATLGLAGRRSALAICGSAQTLGFVERYLASLWPQGRPPVPLRFVALTPGLVTAGAACRIDCFPVRHRGTTSLGYRFEVIAHRHLRSDRLIALGVPTGPLRARLAKGEAIELPDGRRIDPESVRGPPVPGASLAVVGDAEETATLVPAVRGADGLVIEATFLEADAALAAARGHLTAADAGRLAAEAGIGALYLTHLSGRYEPAAVAAEAGRFFPHVSVMKDLDRVTVSAAPRRPT
ncbi:MAG TPA: MBL fold metallo-hydrolase [Stellaceae bacterium]|nr:MBL fold metallo-hydrolase [Stellaceae bacterium]